METLKIILKWLSGKKSVISGIILTTAGYIGALGIIDEKAVAFIGAITILIFGSAAVATKNVVYSGK